MTDDREDWSALIESLKSLSRLMTGAHDRVAERKMIVWKDDIQAVETAIKLIEKIEDSDAVAI